jgi:hypothetical protein
VFDQSLSNNRRSYICKYYNIDNKFKFLGNSFLNENNCNQNELLKENQICDTKSLYKNEDIKVKCNNDEDYIIKDIKILNNNSNKIIDEKFKLSDDIKLIKEKKEVKLDYINKIDITNRLRKRVGMLDLRQQYEKNCDNNIVYTYSQKIKQ